ncbi:MAG TPA: hypothetical protein VFR80_04080 [Pyrinomonadaceae bacterium]|nr:hypothetical protein [Pyrinomonadaceae bacterium]
MDELIKQVVSKTGISEDQARTAITTVLGFVKDKLPAPIANQIDNAITGEGGGVGGSLGDLASKAGGLLS